MAEVRYSGLTYGSVPLVVSENGETVNMNKEGTATFSFVGADVSIGVQEGQMHTYKSTRGVVRAPHGAKVLPYFMRGGEWHVVMVEQFRIALPGKTIEPVGGEVDEETPKQSMVRELEEEAHIVVRSEDVDVVYILYILPSMMRSKVFGGIVKIDESQLPLEIVGGEWSLGEYTVVGTYKLLDLLRSRDDMSWISDIETYLLLDAVAKKVGLLAKLY
ncbi:MAG: NUDIX domain-containing protein [Patescibacteria group bacterium]